MPGQTWALESDRDQPIEIESDRAEFHELEGYTIYSGNVRLSQGSILLEAAEISIYFENGEVYRLVATGDRAYYEQLPAEDEGKVVAQANTIEYLLQGDLINLVQNASLTQDGATLNGELITYDVRNHLLRANNRSTQESTESGRVRVTIPSLGGED
jgi:lipopolysaccharide export system protein LptA